VEIDRFLNNEIKSIMFKPATGVYQIRFRGRLFIVKNETKELAAYTILFIYCTRRFIIDDLFSKDMPLRV